MFSRLPGPRAHLQRVQLEVRLLRLRGWQRRRLDTRVCLPVLTATVYSARAPEVDQ